MSDGIFKNEFGSAAPQLRPQSTNDYKLFCTDLTVCNSGDLLEVKASN